MDDLNTMSKIFGSLFYFPLTHENNRAIIDAIKGNEDLTENGFGDIVNAIESENSDVINDDFFLLFEGGEIMVAPPWGSVYLDREQVIFGDSTLRYRRFLKQHDIELNTGMREPEDQFGLMLFAVSQIIEQHQDQALVEQLFSQHLLPWCLHYLALVAKHAKTSSYRSLANLAKAFCMDVQEAWQLTPAELKVYR
ncbi:DMSO reductase [Moritella sp. Urea-trap-13]|nr:DMSO reductase [Moritella sp. Urea-trap-13]